MTCHELPPAARELCAAFVGGLKEILYAKLHGVYLYGAAVFPDSGPIQDIDCHVILEKSLCDTERDGIRRLLKDLLNRFPPLGAELDAYFILYEDAQGTSPPAHQLRPEIRDESWALHCAHIRAGRYILLHGPEPTEIFPDPSWPEISAALDHEMRFIDENLKHPAYCVLNLCRIIHSFRERDAVISKRFGGNWASARFSQWTPLIQAAVRSYEGTGMPGDEEFLSGEVGCFLEFASERIREARNL